MDKICPILSKVIYLHVLSGAAKHLGNLTKRSWYPGGSVEDQGPELYEVSCKQHQCELWTDTYTIENLPIRGCAIRLNAMKNAEGKVIV